MVKTSATSIGTLYVVATPIGNRDDISLRALATLKSVDCILAEDTRHSAKLLDILGIHKPLQSLHAHNEADKSLKIIEDLEQGQTFALISDAGTPLISDPGFPLVKLAREKHIPVVPIPGACALITALSAAGLPCDNFSFIGFLAAKSTARKTKLKSLMQINHTVVFYESTHRILECLQDISDIFGNEYEFVVAKELTKTFEQFISGNGLEIINWFSEEPSRNKGEFVVILPPYAVDKTPDSNEKEILKVLLKELPLKQAVKIATQLTKINKNELYSLALELTDSEK